MARPRVILSFVFLFFSSALPSVAQLVDWQKIHDRTHRHLRPDTGFSPVPVLLLGAFHFDYPGLDAHKTDKSDMLDVLSAPRQEELRLLLEVIREFQPTRIYVESANRQRIDSLYSAYRAGSYTLGRNEIFQIGFRLAKELNHDKIYAVDASNFARENFKRFSWIDSLWRDRSPVDTIAQEKWDAAYTTAYKRDDAHAVEQTLLETFLINSDKNTWSYLNGHQFVATFATMDTKGPDATALQWYNRNLRIFNNILKTRPQADDRLLVLFGAGHMAVLNHLFESSPEFVTIPFADVAREYEKKSGGRSRSK